MNPDLESTSANGDEGVRLGRFQRSLPMVVAILGVTVFGVLASISWIIADQNEQRMLQEHTEQAGAALTVDITEVKAPLQGAARAARATRGDPATLATMVEPLLGDAATYSSFLLFTIDSATPITQIGDAPRITEDGADVFDVVLERARAEPFVVIDLLHRDRTLGFVAVDNAADPQYVVYAERTLSATPHTRARNDAPFARLHYALYLGAIESPDALLGASLPDLPISGRRAQTIVPYGDAEILLVATPTGSLAGDLSNELWWIVALSGLVGTALIVSLLRRLNLSRNEALRVAADAAARHVEQRDIAETLQLSLLPRRLATPPGVDVASRYWPAGPAALIGGDFYDMFTIDERTWGITIGDVCGKGIDAAALTGLARHTIRTAARSGLGPADVLRAVHTAMADHEPATFCTACFITYAPTQPDERIDGAPIGRLVVALGGHPPPLRSRSGHVDTVGRPGSILGLFEPSLIDTPIDVHAGDTYVLYTDGLTDAPRDEAVPLVEIEELVAARPHDDLDRLADEIRHLKRSRRPTGSSDDTALIIIRFGEDPALLPTPPVDRTTASSPG